MPPYGLYFLFVGNETYCNSFKMKKPVIHRSMNLHLLR